MRTRRMKPENLRLATIGHRPGNASTIAEMKKPRNHHAATGLTSVKAVGLEPTTNGLKVRCSTD